MILTHMILRVLKRKIVDNCARPKKYTVFYIKALNKSQRSFSDREPRMSWLLFLIFQSKVADYMFFYSAGVKRNRSLAVRVCFHLGVVTESTCAL